MNRMRNRWRVICSRHAVPGMWVVGQLQPVDACCPDSWWSDAMFHSYDAAIEYATRRAAGYPRTSALAKAAGVDARVAGDRALRHMAAALSALREAQCLLDGDRRRGGD